MVRSVAAVASRYSASIDSGRGSGIARATYIIREVRSFGDGDRLGGPKEPPGGPPQQPPRRDDKEGDGDGRSGALTLTRTKTKTPAMYKVLMLNDDYTPMEFVVDVLQNIFQKNREEATQVMLHVHQKGVGVCGVYTYEIAETKVTQTVDYARKNQHPLQCTLEKE